MIPAMGHMHSAGHLLRYLFIADAAVVAILTIVLLMAFLQNRSNQRTRMLKIWWVVLVIVGVGLVVADMTMKGHKRRDKSDDTQQSTSMLLDQGSSALIRSLPANI